MAKSTRPSLKFDSIMAVCIESGLPIQEKKNWVKVGFSHARVYVAKVEDVRDIHLSGEWATPLMGAEGTVPTPPNGSVKCGVDMGHPRALGNLARFLEMASKAQPPAKRAKATLVVPVTPAPAQAAKRDGERRAEIARLAASEANEERLFAETAEILASDDSE